MEKKKRKPLVRLSDNQREVVKAEMKALQDTGMSGRKASKEVAARNGISTRTVYNILEKEDKPVLNTKELGQVKKSLISRSYATSLHAQKSITQDKLNKSSFVQLMVGSKIGMEMGRLLEEKSTQNISHRGVFENLDADREKIMEQLKDLGIEQSNDDAS